MGRYAKFLGAYFLVQIVYSEATAVRFDEEIYEGRVDSNRTKNAPSSKTSSHRDPAEGEKASSIEYHGKLLATSVTLDQLLYLYNCGFSQKTFFNTNLWQQ